VKDLHFSLGSADTTSLKAASALHCRGIMSQEELVAYVIEENKKREKEKDHIDKDVVRDVMHGTSLA
jgi:hypothetical protein